MKRVAFQNLLPRHQDIIISNFKAMALRRLPATSYLNKINFDNASRNLCNKQFNFLSSQVSSLALNMCILFSNVIETQLPKLIDIYYAVMSKYSKKFMHWPGIEPGPPAWQARILPLNHQCCSQTGNRTRAAWVKATNPSH